VVAVSQKPPDLNRTAAVLLSVAGAWLLAAEPAAGQSEARVGEPDAWTKESNARTDEWTGNVSIALTAKRLPKGDWGSLADQSGIGVEVTWGRRGWPLQYAVDFLVTENNSARSTSQDPYTYDLGVEPLADTAELALGLRKVWVANRLQAHLGGGLAILSAKLNGEAVGLSGRVFDEDDTIGPWLGGALFWRIGSRWGLGLTARYSRGEVRIFDEEREAGGPQYGITLGWNWPASSSAISSSRLSPTSRQSKRVSTAHCTSQHVLGGTQ
jgi:hypothetical protein